MKTIQCPRCKGRGRIPDQRVLAAEMRKHRHDAGLTLREVATLMGISAAYLCDLELGRRTWSDKLVNQFLNCLKPKKNK